jgi:tRNA(Leu) C34 or U34 (ribose-2'-O)-methylase TrmL
MPHGFACIATPHGRLIARASRIRAGADDARHGPLHRFGFAASDTLLLGRESAGAPDFIHEAAAARVVIPLQAGNRSLNVAMAGGIALYEALRQTGLLPEVDPSGEVSA